jgi:hypothetical protein
MSEENTNETTDTTDTTDESEPSNAELHERVNRLESLIERMLPSRRGVLGGIAAVLGGTYLGSQTVESSTGSAGQIGDANNRPTIKADDITEAGGDEVIADGDGVDRDIYVISAGGSAPSAATNDDIILEKS